MGRPFFAVTDVGLYPHQDQFGSTRALTNSVGRFEALSTGRKALLLGGVAFTGVVVAELVMR